MLADIESLRKCEGWTRSELIREALRIYISESAGSGNLAANKRHSTGIMMVSSLDTPMVNTSQRKQSKKHHYLPRHYLKGFADGEGGFYVYDKVNDRTFYTNPDASFFENDLNTFVLSKGQRSAVLEGLYTDIENHCWPGFDRIRASDQRTSIAYQDKVFTSIFITSLYWRVPSKIETAAKWLELAFTDTSPIDYFTLKHKGGGVIPEEMVNAIRGSEAFKKTFRTILSMAPFLKDKECARKLNNWRFLYSPDPGGFNIVGDNPVLIRNEARGDPATLLDEFIFPISGTITLVQTTPTLTRATFGEFTVQLGIAMIERARRFVLSRNREYLQTLARLHHVVSGSGGAHTIVESLFEMLQRDG
jgi:Protein of unknown function (DUF4238)